MYYFSMFLVVISSVFYHLAQKSINGDINPAISMTITYGVALILSLVAIVFFPSENGLDAFKEANWASYILGISIFVLEIGYLLVYRSGWNINIAALFSNVLLTIVLVVIGLSIYKESISLTNALGIVLSIVGLILMRR